MATLFHWDTPLELEHAGGWMNRETAKRFAVYCAAVAERFGDRVEYRVTMNEPVSVTLQGYALGSFPGPPIAVRFAACRTSSVAETLARSSGPSGCRRYNGQTGVPNMHSPVQPASSSLGDRLMAQALDLILNRIYADAILLGQYPKPPLPMKPWIRSLGTIHDGDLELISQPLDFYGLNYYYPIKVASVRVRPRSLREPQPRRRRFLSIWRHTRSMTTGFGWPVAPERLALLLREMKDGTAMRCLPCTSRRAERASPNLPRGRPHRGREPHLLPRGPSGSCPDGNRTGRNS